MAGVIDSANDPPFYLEKFAATIRRPGCDEVPATPANPKDPITFVNSSVI